MDLSSEGKMLQLNIITFLIDVFHCQLMPAASSHGD